MNTMNEIVMRAIDADGFVTGDTFAGYVTPELWDRQLIDFQMEKVSLARYAKLYDNVLGRPGDTIHVTLDGAPSKAVTVAETADVPVTAQEAGSQVSFTLAEYGARRQVSDLQREAGFVDMMSNMTRKLGYSLGLALEDDVMDLIAANAGNSFIVNGKASTTAVGTADTLDVASVFRVARLIEDDLFEPQELHVTPAGYEQLVTSNPILDASQSGSSAPIRQNALGIIAGLVVYKNTLMNDLTASNVARAFVLGRDADGVPGVGIARSRLPRMERDRSPAGRFSEMIATEVRGQKTLHANAMGIIYHYVA